MQNRSSGPLPAIYVGTASGDTDPFFVSRVPYALEIYDVTYLHFHDTLELGICMSGSGVCYVEDEEYPFRAGDVQVIFPFQRHLSKSNEGSLSRWHWINLDVLSTLSEEGFTEVRVMESWLSAEMGLCGIVREEEHPSVAPLVRRLFAEGMETPERLHKRACCCALLYLLLVELCRASEPLPKLPLRGDKRLLALSPALERIKSDLQQDAMTPVGPLSVICGMSSAQFRRVFRAATGLSPKEYILLCAMSKARRMLLTTRASVLDVGLAAGFESLSSFNRRFLAETGLTPSAFRKRYAPDHGSAGSRSGT